VEQQGWILADKGSKLKRKPDQYYIELSNAYSSLAEFSVDPSPDDAPTRVTSLFKLKSMKRQHQRIQRKTKTKLKDATDTYREQMYRNGKERQIQRAQSSD